MLRFCAGLLFALSAVASLRAEVVRFDGAPDAVPHDRFFHDFVLGSQGQNRPDLPNGEILLQGALDALDRTVDFVRN